MNFLAFFSQVVIELGANELNHSVDAPVKEKGSNHSLNASLYTWYYLYERQTTTKFSKCMWVSSLGSPLTVELIAAFETS